MKSLRLAVAGALALATLAYPALAAGDYLTVQLKDGPVVIELLPDAAPKHVEQIKALATEGEYDNVRSEEHTSELQSLMRISYAVFCLKKKKHSYIDIILST